MIENFVLVFAFIAALMIVYVPATIELRKPSDNGPRIIEGFAPKNKNVFSSEMLEKPDLDCLNQTATAVLKDFADFEI
jgi:hypothetical protein